jgi:isopentenyl-diphosphate delta-isomerase
LLLQKRAKSKYHSGGLWSNTCCGHPRPNEKLEQSAHRRLKEEMGFDCGLNEIMSFIYETKLGNNLFENEYDHVFIGFYDGNPNPDPNEVESWKWFESEELRILFEHFPSEFTYWFKECIDRIVNVDFDHHKV